LNPNKKSVGVSRPTTPNLVKPVNSKSSAVKINVQRSNLAMDYFKIKKELEEDDDFKHAPLSTSRQKPTKY